MDNKDNIISILNAINEINERPPKKKKISANIISSIPKLDQNLIIPPDVDKLIREAEDYRKISTSSFKTNFAKTQLNNSDDKDVLILKDEILENNQNENPKILELNNKVKSLEETNKKLLKQIDNLQKDNSLHSKSENNIKEQIEPRSSEDNAKESLKSIYKQVEKQKQIFLDLKKYSIKIERESNVFKENYERLIIENDKIKTRLKIAKEQIVNYETNKTDLLTVLDQLNEILSKNSIVGINPQNPTSKKLIEKKEETKSETSD